MLSDQETIFKQRALCLGGGYLAFPTAGLRACVRACVCVLLHPLSTLAFWPHLNS